MAPPHSQNMTNIRNNTAITPSVKKILFFDHTASMSGGEIALLHLVETLDRTRFFPIVVLGATGPLQTKLATCGADTHILPLTGDIAGANKDQLGGKTLLQLGAGWRMTRYIIRLARFIRTTKVDLVHTNSLKADIIGGIAARLASTPVIWHVRDRIADDYLPRSVTRVFRGLCRLIPNIILANSAATLQTLQLPSKWIGTVGSRDQRAFVIHDGVYDDAPTNLSETLRSKTSLIGMVGRISPWKGQHIFIEAVALVRVRHPNARFQIIGAALFGEEAYEAKIRARAAELGLDNCLEFTGFRPDIADYIRRLDILVHASTIGEPFGQVVIEGMVAGKPVVATRGGGVPEIVEDGVTGMLVPMGDASAMAKGIMELLNDPEQARIMGMAGRTRVLDHFTVAHTVNKIETVYTAYLNRRNKQPPNVVGT